MLSNVNLQTIVPLRRLPAELLNSILDRSDIQCIHNLRLTCHWLKRCADGVLFGTVNIPCLCCGKETLEQIAKKLGTYADLVKTITFRGMLLFHLAFRLPIRNDECHIEEALANPFSQGVTASVTDWEEYLKQLNKYCRQEFDTMFYDESILGLCTSLFTGLRLLRYERDYGHEGCRFKTAFEAVEDWRDADIYAVP